MPVVNFKDYGSVEALQEAFGDNWRYVGRAMPHYGLQGSPLGNPHRVDGETDRKTAIDYYKQYLWSKIKLKDEPTLAALREIDEDTAVVCWCVPKACHGHVVEKAAAWLRKNGPGEPKPAIQVPTIKVITLWQPWAQLMALGLKKFETRSWSTSYRGLLAIQAAKRSLNWREVPIEARDILIQHGYDQPGDFAYGAIVGVGNLTGCYKTPDNPGDEHWHGDIVMPPPAPECYFGDYSPDRYAWHVPDLKQVQPIGCRGMQGLWTAPDELARQIWARYRRAPVQTAVGVR